MIGCRLFSPKVGLCAGMILATSLMFVVAARAATPDASLIFFMTAALGVFVLAVFPGNTDEARDQDNHSDRGELSTSYPFPNCWFAALSYHEKNNSGFVFVNGPPVFLGLFFSALAIYNTFPGGGLFFSLKDWLGGSWLSPSPLRLAAK